MHTRRNPIADQNLVLAAPIPEHCTLRLALTPALLVLHPVAYRYHAALLKDRRLL